MKTKLISTVKTLFKDNILKRLEKSTNGPMWERAQINLTEYNKSIITLSSSALVLSFSIIKIGNVTPNKYLLGLSWLLFLFAIGAGILIQLLSFIYTLAAGNIDRLYKHKEWKEEMILNPEIALFWNARSWMIWISLVEMLFFFIAIALLITTAFLYI